MRWETISSTLGNYYYSSSVADAAKKVEKGLDLSEVMSSYGQLYPPMMVNMVQVGEGKPVRWRRRSAKWRNSTRTKSSQFTSNLSSVIEPVIMLVMGAAVGYFAIALIQPMYSIMETI